MPDQFNAPELLPDGQQLLAGFLLATEPAPKKQPLTAIEVENRALVKDCRKLIARIKAARRK
jgi:hypothetical protein